MKLITRKIERNYDQEAADECRLQDAESRVEKLLEKADFLRTVVSRRDEQNHWQESVNRLFATGGGTG